jgi:hypothetical protein
MGALAGAAVAPRELLAVELPPAPLIVPPVAAPPAIFEGAVLTNSAIARMALQLLSKNLAFVKAERVRIGDRGARTGDTFAYIPNLPEYRPVSSSLVGYNPVLVDVTMGCFRLQSAVEMDSPRDELRRMSLEEYTHRRLAPAMDLLAENIARNLIGARRLFTVNAALPNASDVSAIRASNDEYSLRFLHYYDVLVNQTRTCIDVLYDTDRARR